LALFPAVTLFYVRASNSPAFQDPNFTHMQNEEFGCAWVAESGKIPEKRKIQVQ